MFELDVVSVKERAGNIVGAALRDVVHELEGAVLPPNRGLSELIVSTCAAEVRERCGIELLSVIVTGDALTDGYLLSEALTAASGTPIVEDWTIGASAILGSRLSPTA